MTITIKSKKRIKATPAEWATVINKWKEMKDNFHPLIPEQIEMYQRLNENIKFYNGQPVLIVADRSGVYFQGYPYKGIILGVSKVYGNFQLKISVTESGELNGDDGLAEVPLSSVLPVVDVHIPNEKELEIFKFDYSMDMIRKSYQSHLEILDSDRIGYERRIDDLEHELENCKHRLVDIMAKLKADKTSLPTNEEIIKSFELLGKHKKVENAHFMPNGYMYIETSMLYTVEQGKETKTKIGKFGFKLSMKGPNDSRFYNLNYCYHDGRHFAHPNLRDGIICSGANANEINNMLKAGRFYEATDFLITFFTLWPQDSGTPHINCARWMEYRVAEKTNKLVLSEKPLWSLYPIKNLKAKVPKAPKTSKTTYTQIDGISNGIPYPHPLGVDFGANSGGLVNVIQPATFSEIDDEIEAEI